MNFKYTVTAWNPTNEIEHANAHFNDYNKAYECLITLCSVGKPWVGFIFDNNANKRRTSVGVALD